MPTGVKMVICLLLLAQSGELSVSHRLDQLNSPDYAIRRAATQTLMQSTDLTDTQLDELYQQAHSPEQKHRIEQIALHLCLKQWMAKLKHSKSQAGSIGIRLHAIKPGTYPHWDKAGIVIDSTLPGFPAHELLQSGDLIIAINNMELAANPTKLDLTQVFTTLVQQQHPGNVITLKIIRQGQQQQVQFPTAPSTCLKQLYTEKRVMDQRVIQLTPMAVKLWQKRLQSLTGQPQAQSSTQKTDNPIPIQWQANAAK